MLVKISVEEKATLKPLLSVFFACMHALYFFATASSQY